MLRSDLESFIKESKQWDLNEWEEDFIISLEEMEDDDHLHITEKQEAVMDKMREKYE